MIVEVIGRRVELPVASVAGEEVPNHFGWLTPFITLDAPASSSRTQQLLGWRPEQPGLIEDLEQDHSTRSEKLPRQRHRASPLRRAGRNPSRDQERSPDGYDD
jgi:hypothetical protein